jgi:uncharacterized protein YutE (UPF0331/DUF86 family)
LVEPTTARKLLDVIEQRLMRLDDLAQTPLEVYQRDVALQDRVERNFEIAIQACLDLGLHLLADVARPTPETNRDVFPAMAREGWIDRALAERLADMAGFRNVLAHGYAALDHSRVHASLNDLPEIRAYLKQLYTHLQATGVLP